MNKTLGVIPARMSSSRFPGKPLEKILDVPMLAHCYERAILSGACDTLVIATPDQEIIDWANKYSIPSILTSHCHQRATERAKETLDILVSQGHSYDLILLLQGDEPQIFPDDIVHLKAAFTGQDFEVVNLIFSIKGKDLVDQNVVKAMLGRNFKINFFTRSHVPYGSNTAFRQLGMIGFTNTALIKYTNLISTPLEELESIDMMRLLENDYPIQGVPSSSPILGVDNPEDILRAEHMMADDNFLGSYKQKYI